MRATRTLFVHGALAADLHESLEELWARHRFSDTNPSKTGETPVEFYECHPSARFRGTHLATRTRVVIYSRSAAHDRFLVTG